MRVMSARSGPCSASVVPPSTAAVRGLNAGFDGSARTLADQDVADGATYADLGTPEREARTAVQAATDEGADEATIAGLQATYDEVSAQRNTLFKGETLRGLLLSTFAWSTVGRIAGIAAVVSFVAAGLMLVLVVLGVVHHRKTPKA